MLKNLKTNALPMMHSALNTLQLKESIQPQAQTLYLKLLMDVLARGLVSASHNDSEVNSEVKGFTVGNTIQMTIAPDVAQFTLKIMPNGHFKIVKNPTQKADLVIKFKHLSLAFLVLTFQESTTTAFARDRMIADGDVSDAVRFVRCLNRLEVLILPKIIANLAVKEYPENMSLKEKLTQGGKVYYGVAKSFF